MENQQNCNQNQNQNQQRSNHNPNSSSSSSNYRGLPPSSTQPLQRRWINRNDSDRISSNNSIVTGADQVMDSVRDRMLNSLAIRGNLTSRRDLLIPEQNRMLYGEIQETIAERFHQVSTNRTPNVQIQELPTEQRDRVSELAMTTGGCEYLQSVIAAEDGRVREAILAIVAADLPILMVHNIGFAFVRALFLSCDEHQMNTVLDSVLVRKENDFLGICNNYYGSENVKVLIYNLKTEAQLNIITNVLEAHISYFTNYIHSQNVLRFFIYTCNHNYSRMRLFNAMASQCLAIATNGLGCRVLQHSICPIFIKERLILPLLNAIIANARVLAEHNYGNYMIQHVIDAKIEGVTKRIVEALMGRFCDLAMNQFGSIVVHKCLRNCEQSELVNIVEEFTNSSQQLIGLARDFFGHYVLLRALEHIHYRGTIQHYQRLVKAIIFAVSKVQNDPYGIIVIQKINELNRKSPFQYPQ